MWVLITGQAMAERMLAAMMRVPLTITASGLAAASRSMVPGVLMLSTWCRFAVGKGASLMP
ncbi:hypothetical protein D3C75_1343180 [compost metagenome]